MGAWRLRLIALGIILAVLGTHGLIAAAAVWRGTVVSVTDGDTVVVLVKQTPYKVRLYGIDTPERKQAYGSAARQALADLVFQQVVSVVTLEKDRYGRHIGLLVLSDGRVVNHLLVQQGMAWVYRQYTRDPVLFALEAEAQAEARGLWGGSEVPIAPWVYRAQQQKR